MQEQEKEQLRVTGESLNFMKLILAVLETNNDDISLKSSCSTSYWLLICWSL